MAEDLDPLEPEIWAAVVEIIEHERISLSQFCAATVRLFPGRPYVESIRVFAIDWYRAGCSGLSDKPKVGFERGQVTATLDGDGRISMAERAAPLFDQVDEIAEAQAIAEAEADIAAGRVVDHDAVRRWLLSWGTNNELPPPTCE